MVASAPAPVLLAQITHGQDRCQEDEASPLGLVRLVAMGEVSQEAEVRLRGVRR